MKMKEFHVEFTKKIEVTLYAPEDMSQADIRELAANVAFDGLRDWGEPDWECFVGRMNEVEVPEEELKLGEPNRFGFRPCLAPLLKGQDVVVVSDDRQDMVAAVDATWWVKEVVESE